MSILKDYERRLKDILEIPDPSIRRITYLGIANGYIDFCLINKNDVYDINQLTFFVKASKIEFLGKIAELTIVNIKELEGYIDSILNYRVSLLKPSNPDFTTDSVLSSLKLNIVLSEDDWNTLNLNPGKFTEANHCVFQYLNSVKNEKNETKTVAEKGNVTLKVEQN